MDDTNASSSSVEPSHTVDAPVLHWSISVVLLSIACAAVAWVSAMGATWGKSHDDAGAMTFALVFLLGIDPFFMRRNHYFTPGGLVIVAYAVYKPRHPTGKRNGVRERGSRNSIAQG